MIDLTSPEWEFINITPANGKQYYNKKMDQVAVKYNKHINIYYNRKLGYNENYPVHFKDEIILNKE